MAEKRRPGRPATGQDRTRGVRIDDKTWGRVEQAAEEDGTTSSAVVRRAVTEHLDRRDQEHGKK
jgi:predicted transcriptional regulator